MSSTSTPTRIAMIGAGSISFTRQLMHDILSVPELADSHFALTDISAENLERVACLCERDIKANDLPATITTTTDRREALAGADFVICLIRQGGLEAFRHDIDIPLKYGVDQCVGDTLCAGGIMYAQRSIAELLGICRDIRECAKPGAIFLNYSNPMAMNTWACNEYGGVTTYGLCHGVQGVRHQIRELTELWARQSGQIAAEETIPVADIDMTAAGINHQTWIVAARWRGIDLLPHLLEWFEAHPRFSKTEKVRIDVLRRFGFYSTESNGHLSEYLPWYRKRSEEIGKWIDLSVWIHGETGGYLRLCTESRNWFEKDYPEWLASEPPKITPSIRSEEHGSYIIEAIKTGRIYRGHFNVQNRHHITNLPNGAVIEVPGFVDRLGIHIPVYGDLPLPCATVCSASIHVQQLGMEAAVTGNMALLRLAMLNDPLVGAVCEPEEVWQMTDELLVAQAQWLPQYADEIPRAKARLEEHERNGTRVQLRLGEGAARLAVRTVEEMGANPRAARKTVAATDKGNLMPGEKD